MVMIEGEEGKEKELLKSEEAVPERDSSSCRVRSNSPSGVMNDVEDEGFETASEGGASGDEETDDARDEIYPCESDVKDDESENFRKGEKKDTETLRVENPVQASTHDGMTEVKQNILLVDIAREEQSKPVEEEKRVRQQRIDEANAAKIGGNSLYAEAKYAEALSCYERGLDICPLKDLEDSGVKEIRAVLYSNRAACYSGLQNYAAVVKESTKALDLNPNYVKALVKRYQAYEKLTNYEEAIGDVRKVLELDPGNTQARVALRHLVPLAEEKREKLKKEMMDKLKQAGNSILGRFGVSIDNFKTVQDPNTGSYSIQFQR